ncbi:MAG: endo alpha-1,4 polygalactosaminidase [Thermoplasmatota archaeon]
MTRICIILLLISFLSAGLAGCLNEEKEEEGEIDPVYRQRMRELVMDIGNYTRQADPDFILIPQNGHDLLSLEPDTAGTPAMDYINSIDGMGQEDLLYGYDGDNRKTPSEETERLQALLDLGEENGLQALVTDYCQDHDKMDDSYERNEARGYISFAADRRDLDNIPDYPGEPFDTNDRNITSLSEAGNFLYLLDTSGFDTREKYLEALRETDYDVLIIDAFFEDGVMLTPQEVSSLRVKENGGSRLVISYISIGEAEDYRYYWKEDWKVGSPEFIDRENPDWDGNYKVKYWDNQWQNVLFGEPDSYFDRLISSGFDGAYMDIIEAFEYYE